MRFQGSGQPKASAVTLCGCLKWE